MKTLVVYYSFEGDTQMIAETIAAETGADVLQLKPVKEMKSKGFSKFVWGGSQVVMKKKPELEPITIDVNSYDTIFIGTPVWANTFAPAVNAFLTDHKLSGKNVGLFCCYLGAAGKTFEKMRAELTGNTILGEIGFVDPKKKGPEEARALAVAFARDCIATASAK